jgi:DNA-binding XRE family transcriptional regulator
MPRRQGEVQMLTIAQAEAKAADFLPRETAPMVMDFDPRRMDVIDVHIGRRIRMRRRMLGLNQSELARRIGVTFQQVHKYETGQSSITAARLYAIAHGLGVTFDYFYDDIAA